MLPLTEISMMQRATSYTGQLEDEGVREAFEERAAILEYVVGLPRERAERMAFSEVVERYGSHVHDELVRKRA